MAETLNTNVFPITVGDEVRGAKFVDFAGLDYFWSKAKSYVDAADKVLSENVATNSAAIASIQSELDSLSGGEGSIATQIQNAISALKLPETYATIESVNGSVASLTSSITKNSEDIATNSAANSAVAADLASHAADVELHVTKAKQDAWDAAATDIATFLKDADMSQNAVDTLAELQAYMAADGSAATELVNKVAANSAAIDSNSAAIAANSKAIGSVVTKMGEDISSAVAAAAEDATSKADAAQAAAISAAATDATSKADAAQAAAISAAATDATNKANTAKSEAISAAATDATEKADAAQAAAIAQAKLDTQESLKGYYTKDEVDTQITETLTTAQGYANTAESNAKTHAETYTNELFNSIKFVEDSDIDGLFTTGE